MPPKQFDTVWEAEPHTIAKIELLGAYLKAWLSILGTAPSRRGQEILYVDGFAGPGEYTNHPAGSPVVAVEAATSVLTTHGAKWTAGDIHCAFVDEDLKRIEHLRNKLSTLSVHDRVHVSTYAETFVNGLALIKAKQPLPFTSVNPLFVFIDPFGATGAPFSSVAELLRSRSSEVLVNLDADGIARIFCAGEEANRDQLLDDIFGAPTWRTVLSLSAEFSVLCRQVLDLYKQRLKGLPGIDYVFSFEMRGKADSLNYFLVFASRHPRGLEKMKESMRSIDQSGAYSFCDADVGQSHLFRFDDPADSALRLYRRYQGQRVQRRELRDYALNESPFTNPIRLLKWLEDEGLIASVEVFAGKKRRKGTFSEDAVVAVVFKPGGLDA